MILHDERSQHECKHGWANWFGFLLYVDVSPSSEFRGWANPYDCVGQIPRGIGRQSARKLNRLLLHTLTVEYTGSE